MHFLDSLKNRLLALLVAGVMVVAIPSPLSAQDASDELNDQLKRLLTQMDRVASAMNESPVDREQLTRQEQITNELALLVQQFSAGEQSAERPSRQQASSDTTQSGSRQGNGQATGDATSGSDPMASPTSELTERQLILKAWGDLPKQLRMRSGTGISPEFLPGYEQLIRDYYRRMSR